MLEQVTMLSPWEGGAGQASVVQGVLEVSSEHCSGVANTCGLTPLCRHGNKVTLTKPFVGMGTK